MEELKKIGLTDNEINVYMYLIEHGKSVASKIAKYLEINRSLTYQVLESLIEKGLVSYSIVDKLKYFRAADPSKLTDFIQHRKEQLEQQELEVMKLIPELKVKYQEKQAEPEFEIYEGMDGFKTVLEDILRSLKSGEEYHVIGWRGIFQSKAKHWSTHWNNRRAKLGIKRKLVTNEKFIPTAKQLPLTEIKYLRKEHDIPLTTIIYADKVATRMWVVDKPYVILIKSKDAYDSFKKYFDLIWKIAKPVS